MPVVDATILRRGTMVYPPQRPPKSEVLGNLIEKAQLQGYITLEDIHDLFPEEDDDLFDRIFFTLQRLGVEIISDEDDETISQGLHTEASSLDPTVHATLENIAADDTIGLYLKEMSRVPLLSLVEEISLAKRIENASTAQEQLGKLNGRGTRKQRYELEEIIRDGDLARDHLIRANTRLVVSIAKKYISRGVPFLDLIQEGNLGLMKAVNKFEYQRGFRFSTYATWWIRQTITRAIADQGRTIRVPVHMTDRIRALYKTSHKLEQSLGRPPTTDELSSELEVDPTRIQWMFQVSWTPISLESPVGDDDESEFGMFVEDEITPSPSQATYEKMLKERIEQVLSTLSPREARIIRLRFGLENGRPYTLEEVGQKFGLTRERIRQIEGKALRRLRHPCRSRLLKDYL
jgi:RNA polymerase primary sigma factor